MLKKLSVGMLFGAVMLVRAVGASAQGIGSNEMSWGDLLPNGLDPHLLADSAMQSYMQNTYDNLYRYEDNPPKLTPWLASSHEASPDGLVWTFHLNQGVEFHDGMKLTAKDVVYSFQRMLALGRGPAGAFKAYLDPANVVAVDDFTVKFTLNKPYSPFLSAISLVAIVNEKLVESHAKGTDHGTEWLSSNEAGSGAYSINPESYRPLAALDLKRFDAHFAGWSHNKSPIEIVRLRPAKEQSTGVLALLRGDIMATDAYFPADQVKRVEDSDGVRVMADESMRPLVIRMNNTRPPFDNIDFRKCLSYAFNYDGYIKAILHGYATRNYGPIPNNLWGAPADLAGYDYDLDKAKASCAKAREAGAPIDRKLEFYAPTEQVEMAQTGQVLQSEARKLGLNIEVVPEPFTSLVSRTAEPETTPDMWVHSVSTYFVDPENWIGQMYDSQFHGTWKASSWYNNTRVDELLGKARVASNQDERRAAYEEASKIIVGDAPDIWIYNAVQLRGISDRVTGFRFTPVGSGAEFRWMSLSPASKQ